jgi:hypothetical protein
MYIAIFNIHLSHWRFGLTSGLVWSKLLYEVFGLGFSKPADNKLYWMGIKKPPIRNREKPF